MDKLFGGQKGPTEAEKAMQRDRYVEANRADVEADQKVALAARAASLRKSLAYNDDKKKGSLGG